MVVQTKPLAEVTHTAPRVLCREIGLVDTMRFVGQFTVGYGDYTAERDELFRDMTLDAMLGAIEQRREQAAINYDAEGDILSVTFAEAEGQKHTGIELTDQIVLYYNPETARPLQLVVLSYRALLQASRRSPLRLDGLASAPVKVCATVTALLQSAPLAAFFQLVDAQGMTPPASRLREIFVPAMLQTVAAA
jgi:hypothetical protein